MMTEKQRDASPRFNGFDGHENVKSGINMLAAKGEILDADEIAEKIVEQRLAVFRAERGENARIIEAS